MSQKNKSKTRKSLAKRFKITKTGKILRRSSGQDHFRAKKTGNTIRKKRKWLDVHPSEVKKIKKMLHF